MDDMWKVPGRVKPKALEFDAIMDESFIPPPLRTAVAPQPNGVKMGEVNGSGATDEQANGQSGQANGAIRNQAQLKDQRQLSLKENLELFVDRYAKQPSDLWNAVLMGSSLFSCRRLSARAISHPDVILSFDKDDDDTLDFVLATANLRAVAYGIPNKTLFQVKGERMPLLPPGSAKTAQRWQGTLSLLSPPPTPSSPA
jgi:ubiquitin-like 1-activating enzyme E1 B